MRDAQLQQFHHHTSRTDNESQYYEMQVAAAMDFKGEVVFDTSKADGQHKKTASNALLRKLRPDFQFTPMSEGLTAACKWFEANHATARGGTSSSSSSAH
jgi:hypothetical protein